MSTPRLPDAWAKIILPSRLAVAKATPGRRCLSAVTSSIEARSFCEAVVDNGWAAMLKVVSLQ